MTSPADDPNVTLLKMSPSTSGIKSNDDMLPLLTAEPDPDPLAGIKHTGDEEDDARAELDALHRGFREHTARELERMQLATESEYWFCVCFKSQDDKDAFLTAAGLVVIGDKYLDGYATAELLGITMPEPDHAERGELHASTQATDRRSQEARCRPREGHRRTQGEGQGQGVQRVS
ncbi:hypothetical protein [Amycolatopsis sp. BJA-103]|uniref:hypothetical protein n=1 Tax=Amycolatopsis sp. BJA-103 TaxID=1911175 RepID=UPI001E58E266|nr:hypothetical protein [Amycolatopsis sp. BJA-103]